VVPACVVCEAGKCAPGRLCVQLVCVVLYVHLVGCVQLVCVGSAACLCCLVCASKYMLFAAGMRCVVHAAGLCFYAVSMCCFVCAAGMCCVCSLNLLCMKLVCAVCAAYMCCVCVCEAVV